jgi:hypothetical protein
MIAMERSAMKKIFFALLAAVIAVPIACGATPEKPLRALWRTAITDTSEYEVKHSFIAPDGTTWMLVNSRVKGKFAGPDRMVEIRGVDKNGQQVAKVDVLFALAATPAAPLGEFYDLALDRSGALVVFAGNPKGDLRALGFDPKTERMLFDRKLVALPGDFYIDRVISTDKAFFIVGRQANDGLVLKLGPDYSLIWKKNLTTEPVTIVSDAAVDDDGSFILAGTVLEKGGNQSLWRASFTPEGEILGREIGPGADGLLATDGHGHYAVVDHLRTSSGYEVWMRGFGADLKEKWSTKLADRLEMPPTFSVTRGSTNWIAALPTSKSSVAVFEVRDGGQIVATYSPPPVSATYERIWNVGSVSVVGGDFIVPFTIMSVGEKGEMRQSISVVRVSRRTS